VGTYETVVVLALVAIVLFLFVREILPVAVTAMLAAGTLMVVPALNWEGAILSPDEGLSGFSSQATITVMMMFVLSAGIERSGAVAYVSYFLRKWAGKGPRRQALTLGAVAGPLSGFVNNTPVVAVLIPVATRLAQATGHSASKLLMPMSFFAMIGGTLTIIGTSTNLLGNALMPTYGLEPFGFFSFTLVGIVALITAMIYFATIGMKLVPERGASTVVDRFDMKGLMAEFEVLPDSEAVGKTLSELGIVRTQNAQAIRIFRGDEIIALPRHTTQLQAGDMVVIQASRERLEKMPAKTGLGISAHLRHGFDEDADPESGIITAELVITPGSNMEGKTLQGIGFREQHDALVIAIRHHDRVAIGPLSRTKLAAGDVLLVQGSSDAINRLGESAMFFLSRERSKPNFRLDKIAISLGILAAVVTVSALGWVPIVAASMAGAVLMVLTGCLKIEEFIASIQWPIILLLAGIIPLGLALQKSGAASLLADGLGTVGGFMPPILFLMLVFLLTSILTEFVSNNASAVLLIPVVAAAAVTLGLDGRPFVLAVMLSASTSMLTPIGYQTNTMVYAPGNYRFTDYIRVGGPLNLLLAIIMPLTIAWLFPLH
jgi:di/tricarboxylate transporter